MESKGVRDKVYRGISSQTIVTVLSGVLEISVFALMSRLLSQEDFGYYAIIVAVVSVFQCLTEAGLGSAVIQRDNASKEYISTAMGLSVSLGLFFSILLFALAKPLSLLMEQGDELVAAFRLMSPTILLFSVNSVVRALFMRALDFMKYGWCQMLAYLASSAIGVIMAIRGYGVYSIIASSIANSLLLTIILFAISGVRPSIRIYKQFVREIVSYGGWLTGSVIVRRITTELDKFILTRWIPVAQIGAYNRPANFITRIADQINGIYDIVLFPILSTLKDDAKQLQKSFLTAVALVSCFSLILMAAFILGAQVIIEIFFGAEWDWLVSIFRVLSISVIFLAYSRIGDCYFRSLGLVKHYCYLRIATCVVTLLCVYVGCQYGIKGVAIGVVVSRFCDCVLKGMYLVVKMSINFVKLLKSLLQPTWITILLTIGCYMFVRQIEYGEYIGVFVFAIVMILLLLSAPKIFGRTYYENVYMVIKEKFFSKILSKDVVKL